MEMTPIAVTALAGLLEAATGQQLAPGRRWRLETELAPLMREHGIATLDGLAAQVGRGRDQTLGQAVVESLLNNETSFFRDLSSFRALTEGGLATLAGLRADRKRLRIWCAGCSTGQEAYSIAIAVAQQKERWAGWDITIVATDISGRAVARARDGVYTQFEVQRGLPITQLIAGFDAEGDQWRIRPELRAAVCFSRHNLLDAPPTSGCDLILCRNVLLYFSGERRRAVLDRLAEAIAPDGLLMLGAGETVLGQTDAFDSDRTLRGLYRPLPRRTALTHW